MTTRDFPWTDTPPEARRTRRLAAAVLRAASMALGQLARRLQPGRRRAAGDPVLEFYAEAGAPEGALYVDGRLVGHLDGVSRL
jgi:hypothetical protein